MRRESQPFSAAIVSAVDLEVNPGSTAATELVPFVYEELRRMARHQMSRERSDDTLQPTALVHEAYVRLVGDNRMCAWDSRAHFFAAAAEAMRRILVERARRRSSIKHGGAAHRVALDEEAIRVESDAEDLLALDEALAKFGERHPDKARLVTLRYFAGLTSAEAASVLGLSCSTADRYWAFAKAWLYREIAS